MCIHLLHRRLLRGPEARPRHRAPRSSPSPRSDFTLLPPPAGKKRLLRDPSPPPTTKLYPWTVPTAGGTHTSAGSPPHLSLSASAAILPAPPTRAPLAHCAGAGAGRRRRRSGPGRQHGGRAEAGAGHRGAAADGALGGRLHQPGPELRHGPRPGVREEQLQGGGAGGGPPARAGRRL